MIQTFYPQRANLDPSRMLDPEAERWVIEQAELKYSPPAPAAKTRVIHPTTTTATTPPPTAPPQGRLTNDSPMPFGQYAGRKMVSVPLSELNQWWHWYKAWSSRPTVMGQLLRYIRDHIRSFEKLNDDLIW